MRSSKLPLQFLPICVCLVAFGLRLGPLWANRFHSDEALYATWALEIASGRDVLLSSAAPDKPPLLFYTLAAAFLALGRVEVAARLAGLMAGSISVALTWRLAGGIQMPPFIPAAAMALSPFAILFSPTAFLDPLMVMFVLASLVAATRRRPGWAGVFLGLAAATKVQALVFSPLVVALGLLISKSLPENLGSVGPCPQGAFGSARRPQEAKRVLRQAASSSLRAVPAAFGRFLAGLVIPLSAVLVWDRLRGGVPFWVQQTINYGGIRPVYAGELMPRLAGWAGFLPHFFGWPMLAVLAVGLPALLIYDLTRGARTRAAVLDLTLMSFTLGYFMLHWLLAFPVWDRYMLGLVPVICLLIGRLASLVYRFSVGRVGNAMVVVLVLALLIPPAAQAFQSATPIGGDHGPHDGIDRIAAFLRDLPYGTVVYDHWLGWVLRYYLWDANVYVAYFATPGSLAEDLHVFGRTSPRYIVFSSDESTTRIERVIAADGFALSPVLSAQDRHGRPTFTLYRIDAHAAH